MVNTYDKLEVAALAGELEPRMPKPVGPTGDDLGAHREDQRRIPMRRSLTPVKMNGDAARRKVGARTTGLERAPCRKTRAVSKRHGSTIACRRSC